MPKVESYEDKRYDRGKDFLPALRQAYEDLKVELNSMHGWNRAVQDINGFTMRLGEGTMELTIARIEVTTPSLLHLVEGVGKDLLKQAEGELKKRFKKSTGKTLKLKKKSEDRDHFHVGRISAENSWMLSSNRNGYGNRPTGKFMIVDKVVYEWSV